MANTHKPLKALSEVLKNLFTKNTTSQYPATKASVDTRFRAKIKFTPPKCIGCKICMRNCPAFAINIIHTNPDEKQMLDGKEIPAKRKFKCDIDLAKCIYCAQCVDSCPKDALHSTKEFELACFDKKDLLDETQ